MTTMKQLQTQIDVLETQIRELKAAQDTRGHCFGCMCNNIIYYPTSATNLSASNWQLFKTGAPNPPMAPGGNTGTPTP